MIVATLESKTDESESMKARTRPCFNRSRLKNGLGREMGCPHFDLARSHPIAESKYSKLRATDPARKPVLLT